MIQKVFAAILLGVSFSSAEAATHVHKIYGLGPESAPNCEAMIDDIAASIAQQYNVQVAASFCETSPSTGRTTGLVSYSAAEALTEVSTYTFGATYAPKGIYQSREHCVTALARETEIFERFTGLSVAYSFCGKEALRTRNSWYPYITAFGTPEMEPFRLSWRSDKPYDLGTEEILAGLNQYFPSEAVTFTHVIYHYSGVSGEFGAFFYARPETRADISVYSNTVASIPGLQACHEAALRLRQESVLVAGKPVALSYCASDYSNPSKFQLTIVHEGMTFLDSIQDSRKFDSLAACNAERPSIEAELRTVHGDKLVTTICGHPRFSLASGAPFYVIAAKHY